MVLALDDAAPRILDTLTKRGISNTRNLENNVRNIGNLLDAIYSFTNYHRFVYDSKCQSASEFYLNSTVTTTKSYDFMDYFDSIEDSIMDIKLKDGYMNLMVRLSKTDYVMDSKKGTGLPVINLTLLTSCKGGSQVLGQVAVVKGVYPNLYVDPSITALPCSGANKCPRCVSTEVTESSGKTSMKHTYCYMTEKKIKEGACLVNSFNIYRLLNTLAYVWDTYTNRHTLERKNSTRKQSYQRHEVSTIVREPNKTVILPVHSYYQYERQHKEWQGGHHKAPVEHERRDHVRHIYNKDGTLRKVVPVKGCVVNQGKTKAIYEVKAQNEPKRTEMEELDSF